MGVPSRKGGQVSLGAFQCCRGKVGQAPFSFSGPTLGRTNVSAYRRQSHDGAGEARAPRARPHLCVRVEGLVMRHCGGGN
jgi:hypothetical protein